MKTKFKTILLVCSFLPIISICQNRTIIDFHQYDESGPTYTGDFVSHFEAFLNRHFMVFSSGDARLFVKGDGSISINISQPYSGANIQSVDIELNVINGNVYTEFSIESYGYLLFKDLFHQTGFLRIKPTRTTGGAWSGPNYIIFIRPVVPTHLSGALVLYPREMFIDIRRIIINWGG